MLNETVVALIPAYEPDNELIKLLMEIKSKTKYGIVVVDDGSSKDKAPIFGKAGDYAIVLHHKQNEGKGKAIKTGLKYISKNYLKNTVVVTMDSDGQHRVDDAMKVCNASFDNYNSLVIGSREFKGSVPARSRFGNTVTRFVYKMVTGVKVYDTQTGLRAFTGNMIPFMLSVEGNRYEYEMNVLLESARNKVGIIEIPIETLYIQNNKSSHFKSVKDSARIYKDIFKFAASSVISFLIDFSIYSIMIWFTKGMNVSTGIIISNIIARVVSSSVNFYINKKYVFKNTDSIFKTATGYFILAACILFLNTSILTFLVNNVFRNKFICKLLVEIILFTVSLIVQRFFIFKRKSESKKFKR